MARRRRVTYRPSKPQAILGGVMGCLFVIVGLFVVIPQFSMAGGYGLIFGVVWTVFAAVIAGISFYQAFGRGYMGPEIHIEEENGTSPRPEAAPEERLRQLQTLYDQRLITAEEYERKRQEILKEL